ncbi:type II toxin-antitoxin system mRNA interferase toxin, RelE/StbE family [Bacteriovorax sp. PP10]|uniref:Type II toxin-antitoxin system mRNA interferase toxin, RelE/StbE family n=1 Tax=Bacteriovorax antarcticus TaxID=3088717 RepID=A0ABU5VVN4_9BACT|nr:type II toxin-antitoxin system mRNA interferase toxin, RelE/StbE family [Bacteriovorax sp. PP10]MEA9356414.1 type II toxin-antitoxin system mRNA interferase toxin, RelE/StbE family [Bacteriovorax sp. PP10]
MYKVDFTLVDKDLSRLPKYIRDKAYEWAGSVEYAGLEEMRKKPGLHDEPLKGRLAGLRSVRLNRAYRLIYKLEKEAIIHVIVIEVNKHEY